MDFGLARFYRVKGVHAPFEKKAGYRGTANFMSLNAHKVISLSRRNDTESLSYVLLSLKQPTFRWKLYEKDLRRPEWSTMEYILHCKSEQDWAFRKEGKGEEFFWLAMTGRHLEYEAEPPYDKMRARMLNEFLL